MSDEEKKKKQEPRKNPYTLKGFMNILQGKPAETAKKDRKDSSKSLN